MSSAVPDPTSMSPSEIAAAVVGNLRSAIDELQAIDLTAFTDESMIEILRDVVREERRVPAVRNALVAETNARGIPRDKHFRSTGLFLRDLVRVSKGEGAGWVRDARELTPKRSLTTGELLPPPLPEVTAAVAQGAISTTHARVIADTMRRVPAAVGPEARAVGEEWLVESARTLDPDALAKDCQAFLDRVDPDGDLGTDEERALRRSFHIGRQGRDGMYPVRGRLDPVPSKGAPDLRVSDQRNHDALGEICRRVLADGDLPSRHGLPGKLIVYATLDQIEQRCGLASTVHGGLIPVRDLLRMGVDLGVIPVVFDSDGIPLHFGEEQRTGTLHQRISLAIMDGGCTFQSCEIPAAWCQTAHKDPFCKSKQTKIDELALLCQLHHIIVDRQGWEIERVHGRVWLTPPDWIDPQRGPRTNQHFKPLADTLC